jgi:hypothetical protein
MTNNRNRKKGKESVKLGNSCYEVFLGLWERLSGVGAQGKTLTSSAVSGHVICVLSSSSSSGAFVQLAQDIVAERGFILGVCI